ncbi:hypothetical protein Q4506_02195 [Colwellia sp. 4_MG-2023]|jgi:hypothetical protein|uniref:hypothetical protein n=1 Tax=unclassified Colwellia TaxID=196834 RepID=UPI001C098EA2|nr:MULTISPECIES: hypothetical protein [unclassified Colwellia]MBU2923689.1 hypothetical protein [Colwellia sp. C2M11]MDO6486256.1 hypothetical protein [Colwellia sp. 6_MG-2023]MDO6505788.1 hypothetical protein [Colwellia sp. 5_MG-2023]MDO6554469.1 hypothetical protein [Colwellia sp. 4_MG-2023]MDO6652211.1 hypothetical protein [Colwellia sp. 3_MG-2023]
MKLSKTAWNNVIIFSVMIIILIINTTNNRLFPETDTNDELILPEHSVILTLSIAFPNNTSVVFERVARAWKTNSQGVLVDLTNQQIDQMMFAWQQGSGLMQASDIVIEGQESIEISIGIAGVEQEQLFRLYPLVEQLLVYNQQKKIWLALPATMKHQLIPLF